MESKCYIHGRPILHLKNYVMSVEKCQLACQINQDCQYFSYDRQKLSCTLHQTLDTKCFTLIGPKFPPIDQCRSKLHTFSNKTADMLKNINFPKLQRKQRPNIKKVQKGRNKVEQW